MLRAGASLVVCSALAAAQAPSFRHDVMPVLARSGCAAAACHGGATGRGGFKLSLFGSDPAADWRAIAEQHLGRRVDVSAPEASLLLRKASKRYEHGGGRVLRREDAEYATLLAWIRSGAPSDLETAPRVEALRLERDGQRVRAWARLAGRDAETRVDGRAQYWSSDPASLRVESDGRFEVLREGQQWIFARYCGATARLRVLRPFGDVEQGRARVALRRDKLLVDEAARQVDALWRAELAELGLTEGPRAPGAVLLRRLVVDLAERPPSAKELASGASHALVDRLCGTADFDAVVGGMFESMLEIERDDPVVGDRDGRLGALRALVREHSPRIETLAGLADALLGGGLRPVLTRHADARDRAEFYGRSLLGIRLGCARCHDHPSDRWRRDEHLAFSACFVDRGQGSGRLYDDEGEVVEARLLAFAATGRAAAQRDSVGRAPGLDEVRAFTSGDAALLAARAWCHRVFVRLFGRALYEPVNDQRLTNPALHGRVLEQLAADMLANGGRLDRPFRVLARTSLYACASGDEAEDRVAVRQLARRAVRVLAPERRLRVAAGALGVARRRAFLSPSPVRAELELRHAPHLQRMLGESGGLVDVLAMTASPDDRLEELWRALLARAPTDEERRAFGALARDGDIEALRDLAFAVLCSTEFSVIR